ncbi:hypothetical protein [Deinococcus arcticus]|uniref:Uncharacterized protein n=1 Tax=Deinococcus arcticus TaxID=2136176 RepID=A0A2T3WB44_9DEIO|nr:hypothetical protein [Deinococcus arcticus]PTA69125.1 hypothetical protein C8263_04890 [Deinococcus arcticus]
MTRRTATEPAPRGRDDSLLLPRALAVLALLGTGVQLDLWLPPADHHALFWALAAGQAGWLVRRLVRGPGQATAQDHGQRLLMTMMVLLTAQLLGRWLVRALEAGVSVMEGAVLTMLVALLGLFVVSACRPVTAS